MMNPRTKLTLVAAISLLCTVVTFPFWGMGAAVFLDSERMIISRSSSPDQSRIAQVERIVVGGVPSIVVMVRSRWMPNSYLAGCAAASHYQDAKASVRWASKDAIVVTHTGDRLFWHTGSAPFHRAPCDGLTVAFNKSSS